MSRHRFGLNIEAGSYTPEEIMQLGRQVPATTHLIMNDPALAQRLYEQSGGSLIAISRADWPDDTPEIPVEDLIRRWDERRRSVPNVYHYFPNEPVVAGRRELERLLRALITLMQRSRQTGIKMVIGNFAWGNILFNGDVDAGVWDDFIREASAWTRDGFGFVGGHDYTWGVIPFGAAKRNPYDMLTPGLVQEDRWPGADEVKEQYRDNWLMLRWMMLAKRAEVLGVPMFRMVITEAPLDRMPNLEVDVEIAPGAKRRGVIAEFDITHGRTRGPLSQRSLFKFWWPQWTIEQAMMKQVAWMDAVYPDYVVGFTFFAVNRAWPDYNYKDWPALIAELSGYRKDVGVAIDFSNETPMQIRPTGDYGINFRSEPVVGQNVLGTFPAHEWTSVIQFPNNAPANGYVPVRWLGIVGFVKSVLLEWQPEVTVVPVERSVLNEILSAAETIKESAAFLTAALGKLPR